MRKTRFADAARSPTAVRRQILLFFVFPRFHRGLPLFHAYGVQPHLDTKKRRSRGRLRSHTRKQLAVSNWHSAKPNSKTNDTKRGWHLITRKTKSCRVGNPAMAFT